MITHSIRKTYLPPLMQNQSRLPGRRTFLLSSPDINSQSTLDDYLNARPWAKVGTFLCFDHTKNLDALHQIHLIVSVQRDYDKLIKPYNGFDKDPKAYRIINMNLQSGGMSMWDRMDSIIGFRILREDEIDRWINKNDHLQNNLQLWARQNGVELPQRSNTQGPEVQGDSLPPGVS